MLEKRLAVAAVLCHLTLAAPGALAQQYEETTPGAIADPSSYKGSMQLQEQEAQQYQQQAQQNEAMQQRLNSTYQQYSPQAGGGGGATGARTVNLWNLPPLAPDRNPLLGRWHQIASKGVSADQAGGSLGGLLPGAGEAIAKMVNATTAGGCDSIFGKGVVAFEADSLQWVAPDGHEEILNHVAYRANNNDIVVLTRDPGAIPALFFGMPGHDRAVVAILNCTLERVGAKGVVARNAPAAGAPVAAAPAGPADAWLEFRVGASASGQFEPMDRVQIWVTPEDPRSALANGGAPPASVSDRLAADCKEPANCARDWKLMAAHALGAIRTDAAGRAKTPALAHGRYYLVGHASYGMTGWLFWHQPVDLKPGANTVTLDQTNGSVMH